MSSKSKRKNRGNAKRGKINAYPLVDALADKLNKLPNEKKEMLRNLWSHDNKKKIRLAHLGGEKSRGRGFVIDRNHLVDGLTTRMDQTREIYDPRDIKLKYMDNGPNNLYDMIKREIYDNSLVSNFKKNARMRLTNKNVKCAAQMNGNAMKHGSLIHQELYKAIFYIVKKSKITTLINNVGGKTENYINEDKRKLPKSFLVDHCTISALKFFLTKSIIPISSEWPAFTREPPGCATAIDIIAIDYNNNHKLSVIEIKTGNFDWAIQLPRAGESQWMGVFISMWQLIMSALFCRMCYGKIFEWTKTDMKLIYVRPWGCVMLNIPKNFRSPEFCQLIWDITMNPVESFSSVLSDKDKKSPRYMSIYNERIKNNKRIKSNRGVIDKSLRSHLNSQINTESHMTTNGTTRKRKPKEYEVGFSK